MKNILPPPQKNFLLGGNSFSKLFFQFLFCLFLSTFFCSCSYKTYFTKEIWDYAESNKIPLTDLQYYNTKKVILKRELKSSEIKEADAKIVFKDGKYTELVILKKNTKGACIKVRDNRTVDIAFEKGDNKFLTFNISADNFLEGTNDGKYANEIQYDGKKYSINRIDVKLKVKGKDIKKHKKKKRKMKGVKVK